MKVFFIKLLMATLLKIFTTRPRSQQLTFSFCHVKRSCNKMADPLAKKAENGLELQV